jgi:outer membrane protein, heavy metal efflux system
MIRITSIFLISAFASFSVDAQTSLEKILSVVEKNNKSILAEKQYWEAQKLSYKTGLTLDNPKAEFDYMLGSPEGAGNQRDIALTQGFDFPTAYGKRKNVSEEQIIQTDFQLKSYRQEILLEAKMQCLELIYRNNLQTQLDQRLENANRLLEATNRKTEQGESNILDLNKIKLLQLEIKNQINLNTTALKMIQHKLDEMNGGNPLDVSQVDFPLVSGLPPFEALDSLIEANDPVVKAVEQEKEITREQVALSKSLSLPKLEGGYHQQAILGQKYQGFHVGMTIPLWENKNKVKTQKARLTHNELQIQEHRTKHYFENKQLYEQYVHWQKTFDEYQAILTSANNEQLLGKALEHGELSLIEYLMEVRYFYDAIGKLYEAEHELHQAIAALYKFQL